MNPIIRSIAVTAVAALLTVGCDVFIEVPEEDTTLVAENTMDGIDVTDGLAISTIDIDLRNLTIGDIQIPSLPAGTVSEEVITERSGNVSVFISSAHMYETTALGSVTRIFEDIDVMETYIAEGELNTVSFDDDFADRFISSLGKKLVK